jgi:hypothetical protein
MHTVRKSNTVVSLYTNLKHKRRPCRRRKDVECNLNCHQQTYSNNIPPHELGSGAPQQVRDRVEVPTVELIVQCSCERDTDEIGNKDCTNNEVWS